MEQTVRQVVDQFEDLLSEGELGTSAPCWGKVLSLASESNYGTTVASVDFDLGTLGMNPRQALDKICRGLRIVFGGAGRCKVDLGESQGSHPIKLTFTLKKRR